MTSNLSTPLAPRAPRRKLLPTPRQYDLASFAEAELADLDFMLDLCWGFLITIGILVGLLGVMMREFSFVRQPNNLRQKTRLPLVIATSAIVFFIVGYGFTAEVEGGVLGHSHFLGDLPEMSDHHKFTLFLAMNIMMTALATTSVADRAHLDTHLFFAMVSSTIIFPIILAWIWSNGWLRELGFEDNSGAAILHLPAGAISLVANLAIKPSLRSTYFQHRLSYLQQINWSSKKKEAELPGHQTAESTPSGMADTFHPSSSEVKAQFQQQQMADSKDFSKSEASRFNRPFGSEFFSSSSKDVVGLSIQSHSPKLPVSQFKREGEQKLQSTSQSSFELSDFSLKADSPMNSRGTPRVALSSMPIEFPAATPPTAHHLPGPKTSHPNIFKDLGTLQDTIDLPQPKQDVRPNDVTADFMEAPSFLSPIPLLGKSDPLAAAPRPASGYNRCLSQRSNSLSFMSEFNNMLPGCDSNASHLTRDFHKRSSGNHPLSSRQPLLASHKRKKKLNSAEMAALQAFKREFPEVVHLPNRDLVKILSLFTTTKDELSDLSLDNLGCFTLWFCYLLLNGLAGGAMSPKEIDNFGKTLIIYPLCASFSGAIVAICFQLLQLSNLQHLQHRAQDEILLKTLMGGALSGLVANSASCSVCPLWTAPIIGGAGGFFNLLSAGFLDQFGIQDELQIISVNGIGSLIALLSRGVFDSEDGLFISGRATKLGVQALGALAVACWTAFISSLFYFLLAWQGRLRVSIASEMIGADLISYDSQGRLRREKWAE